MKKEFEERIKPFFWVEHDTSYSVCLTVGEYLQEVFNTREDEGFEGNGYELGYYIIFLYEDVPNLQENIYFDPRGKYVCSIFKR